MMSDAFRVQAMYFAAVALSAFIVRVFWIEHSALWIDEVFTVLYARNDVSHLLSLTRTSDIHPPLYYIVVKTVVTLFGEGDGTGLRLISATASALSAGVLFLFCRSRFGGSIAIIAALFFVFMPVSVHYARELRTYALLSFALLLAIVFFAEMLDETLSKRARYLVALCYVISLILTFHLHYSAIVYFFLFGIATFVLWRLGADTAGLRLTLAATAMAALICLPQAFHFFWARSHVAGDFWIEPTTLQSLYSVSLGAYPFPFWAKPIVYPLYILGAYLLWCRDRFLFVIAITFLVGGPLTTALIGFVTPAYLVRTIQAFTVLSPLLLALPILALPRYMRFPAVAVLLTVHILTIRMEYSYEREELAIDLIAPLVSEVDPEIVYYFAPLEDQLDLRHISKDRWLSIELENIQALDRIKERLEWCFERNDCGPTMLIMERAPLFQVEDGKVWMAGMDELVTSYSVKKDTDISGMRVLVIH